MTQWKHKRVAWGLAVASTALSLVFWLQKGLYEIESWRKSTAVASAFDVESIVGPVVTKHRAAPEQEPPVVEQNTLPALKTDLQGWELRKAYAVSIPALGIRAPVLLPSRTYWDKQEWARLEEQMQAGMLHGVVAYPHSNRPGAGGSLFIAGHSSPPSEEAKVSAYGDVFEALSDIRIGTEITVIDGDERFTYVATDAFVVSASDTRILAPGYEDNALTLITCYPVGTARQRFVVKAKLI